MPAEIERKLIVRPGASIDAIPREFPFLERRRVREITQGYLGHGSRIRRSEYVDGPTVHEYAFKAMTTKGLREVECEIPQDDYDVFLEEKATHGVLRKHRTAFACARTGLVLEVDVFGTGSPQRPSFVMAEIEFKSEHAYEILRDSLGDFVFHEVAKSDRAFENARLATPTGMLAALARLDEIGLPR